MISKEQWILLALAVTAFGVLLTLWIVFVHPDMSKGAYATFALKHFQAAFGLPMAAIAALVLVTYLQQKSGEGIKFKGLGFEFTGPSGQIVLWVLCFVVIALMVKALW